MIKKWKRNIKKFDQENNRRRKDTFRAKWKIEMDQALLYSVWKALLHRSALLGCHFKWEKMTVLHEKGLYSTNHLGVYATGTEKIVAGLPSLCQLMFNKWWTKGCKYDATSQQSLMFYHLLKSYGKNQTRNQFILLLPSWICALFFTFWLISLTS